MDPISLGYYAAVCGVLGFVAPLLGGFLSRLILGAVVGAIAAAALPWITESLTASGYIAAG